MDRFTTISVDESTRERLKRHKNDETYDELLTDLLDTYERRCH